MPGSSAADGAPPSVPTQADIIQLHERRPSAALTGPEPIGAEIVAEPSPEHVLIERIQALYLHHERTLTDPSTAEAHQIATEGALLVVDAVLAQGHISTKGHQVLRSTLEAVWRVPERL